MSIELKIKSKHLSEEARIIRFEEHKLKRIARRARKAQKADRATTTMKDWFSINSHRRWDVRNENRATFLARAYMEGKPYSSVERSRHEDFKFYQFILPRVCSMVATYSKDLTAAELEFKNNRTVASPLLKEKIKTWTETT